MNRYEIALGKPPPPAEPVPETKILGNKFLVLGPRRSGKTSALMQDCLQELAQNKMIFYIGNNRDAVDRFLRRARANQDFNSSLLRGWSWETFIQGSSGYKSDVVYLDDLDTFGPYLGPEGVDYLVDQLISHLGQRFEGTKIIFTCSPGSVATLPQSKGVYYLGRHNWQCHSLEAG